MLLFFLSTMSLAGNANSVHRRVDWGGSEHSRHAGRFLPWHALLARAFFSGDSFLYTSKEKSYPLLRRRSGSSGSESYPLLRRRSGSLGFEGRQEKDKVQRKNWIPACAGMTS